MTEVTLSNGQTITLHCNMSVMLKREKAMLNPEVRQNKTMLSLLVILAMAQAADPQTPVTIEQLMSLDNFEDFNALDQAAVSELFRMLGTTAEDFAAAHGAAPSAADNTAEPAKP